MNKALQELMNQYQEAWTNHPIMDQSLNVEAINRIFELSNLEGNVFDRDFYKPGHITGSAIVVSKDMKRVLLTHHKKLGKWLQLGGHADGDSDVAAAALREAVEESGLESLAFLNYESLFFKTADFHPLPVDVDVHLIPARKDAPEHFHFDIRYLVVTHEGEDFTCSPESNSLSWFTFAEAKQLTSEESLIRFLTKAERIIERFLRNPHQA